MKKALLLTVAAAALIVAPALASAQMTIMPSQRGPQKPRSAASIECSKEADAKGLHGKARHAFRSKCKTGMKTGMSGTKANSAKTSSVKTWRSLTGQASQ